MNNLKRVLSLALASIMLIGMMAVGASAVDVSEFSDGDKVTHTEAVGTMASLGVIKGNTDGTYAPERIVKRGEMAAIITRVLNGGVEPTLGTSTSPLFTDVTTHWSRPYVEYCANLGIVNGMGDGTFHPEDPVTGAQAAKMLLVAAGYKSDIYGFTGSDWELNVNRIANQKGLYAELALTTTSEGLSRDNAAQMSYNALDVHPIVASYSQDRKTGDVTEIYGEDTDYASVLAKYFGAIKVVGTVVANEFTDGADMKGKTQLNVTNYGAALEQNVLDDGIYMLATGASELGKSVTLFAKPNTAAPANTQKAVLVGTATVNDNNTVYTITGSLGSTKTARTAALKAKGLKFDDANDIIVMVNYDVVDRDGGAGTDDANPDTNEDVYAGGKGIETTFIDNNGDGVIDVVMSLQKSFGKITTFATADDGSLAINNLGSIALNTGVAGGVNFTAITTNLAVTDDGTGFNTDDAATYVDGWGTDAFTAKKGDFVFYYYVKGAEKLYVEKAEGTTVTVDAFTANDTIKAGSDSYTKSALADGTDMDSAAGNHATLQASAALGKEAVLYLDSNKTVVYVTGVKADTHYLMLTKFSTSYGAWGDTLTAQVLLEDGSKATITIAEIDGRTVSTANDDADEIKPATATGKNQGTSADYSNWGYQDAIVGNANGKVFTYTTNSDGSYNLTAATTVYAGSLNVTNTKPAITAGVVADDKTSFLMADTATGTYTEYTGISTIPSKTSATNVYAVTSSGIAKFVVVVGGTGATSANNYMYFLSKDPTVTLDADGANVYTYDVIRNGEATTIVGVNNLVTNAGLYKVTLTGTKATAATNVDTAIVVPGLVTTASNGVVANSIGSYYYDDATKFIIVAGATAAKVSEGTVESIVTEGGSQDQIAMLLGTGSAANTAKYVFIVRNPISSYAVASVTNASAPATTGTTSGTAVTVTPGIALSTGTVKLASATLFDIDAEITAIHTAKSDTAVKSVRIVKITVPGKTVTDDPTITVTKYSDNNFTTAYTTNSSGKLDADDGTNGTIYIILYDNIQSFKVTEGSNNYFYKVG